MRRTLVAAAIALVATVVALLLYLDNRRLERENARLKKAEPVAVANDPWAPAPVTADGPRRVVPPVVPPVVGEEPMDEPADEPTESRGERKARRQAELAAFLGREPGESEEDYRARIMPLLEAGLARPRDDVAAARAEAEAAANVTPEQHAKLDAAFNEVYDDLLQYTDGAIADGQLSPYESNIAGMLDYAGGLGGILTNAQQRIGGILSADQMRAMSANGFEWAEYLGVSAPWERLHAPPPAPGGS